MREPGNRTARKSQLRRTAIAWFVVWLGVVVIAFPQFSSADGIMNMLQNAGDNPLPLVLLAASIFSLAMAIRYLLLFLGVAPDSDDSSESSRS